MFHRQIFSTILLLAFSGSHAKAEMWRSSNGATATFVKKESEAKTPSQLASLKGTIPSSIVSKNEPNTTHISLVLVGDTGYAPTRARPNSKGVSKHGTWQTWPQTTANIRHHINGDINFANMESVVSANGNLRPRPKAFNFVTHPNGVKHLVDIGFDLFSMANNHSFDYGAKGIRDSLKHMNELTAGKRVIHAGIGLNRNEASNVPVFQRKGTQFAFGAIGIGASYGGLPRATNKRPGQLNLYNSADRKLLMDKLSGANADYRILSIHRGTERNIRTSRDEISKIRRTMLSQGNIDLVIGHHAHVTRGVEINNGKLIFYGLGNFLHQGTANMAGSGACRDYSILARVHLVKTGTSKPQLAAVEVVPITATHLRTKPMKPRKASRRMAILNGLASQFDDRSKGATGIRFAIRKDGTGLYCTGNAGNNDKTAALCRGYRPYTNSNAKIFRSALNTCGSSFGPKVFAKLQSSAPTAKIKLQNAVQPKTAKQKVALKKSAPKQRNARKFEARAIPVKFDPSKFQRLSNKQLAQISATQRKRYWTRYWYVKRGRKIPHHLR